MKHLFYTLLMSLAMPALAQQTQKPPLHGKNRMAVTGKPLAAEAAELGR